MFIPPCYDYKTKTDCPRRAAGCAETCEEWAKYEQLRNQKYQERSNEAKTIDRGYFRTRAYYEKLKRGKR